MIRLSKFAHSARTQSNAQEALAEPLCLGALVAELQTWTYKTCLRCRLHNQLLQSKSATQRKLNSSTRAGYKIKSLTQVRLQFYILTSIFYIQTSHLFLGFSSK